MNGDQPNNDINDVFDEILFCEEKHSESGYKEGHLKGSLQGASEGYHLGYHRGAEIGSEIGFYSSIADFYSDPSNQVSSEKANSTIVKLKDLISSFPKTNDEDLNIIELTENIRILFKRLCSLLKINVSYPEVDNFSF